MPAVALFWFGSILAVNAVLSLYLIEGLGFAPLSAALIMTGSSLAMALTSAFGRRLVARFGRSAVGFAIVGEILVLLGYIAAVNPIPREHLIPVLVILAVLSGVASGCVDAPNRVLLSNTNRRERWQTAVGEGRELAFCGSSRFVGGRARVTRGACVTHGLGVVGRYLCGDRSQ
ncbi:hypothetical protein R3Q06_25435 [Rhodococcus erythropolis]|uniref:MFS transporter n=1 Tax=Rhodococcus erythropolis TaxID=1833 RepID=UPI002948CAB9|nr:MFS transporter [Rhodococcus erythropolis]MDV6276846.1 hypothetical protein [Rhodococcus erythropolis]